MISIIIPTYNEAENIADLVVHIKKHIGVIQHEIIVVDAGSEDKTAVIAHNCGACLVLKSPQPGRAAQMNYGVEHASGDIFHFIHADSRPHPNAFKGIIKAVQEGYDSGMFRFRFDRNKGMLRWNSWMTRFNIKYCRGGDQTLFMTRALWNKTGPYDSSMKIMEEYDLLERIWKLGNFTVLKLETIVSARKYEENSWFRVQWANFKVARLYEKGGSQEEMLKTYRTVLNYRKNAF